MGHVKAPYVAPASMGAASPETDFHPSSPHLPSGAGARVRRLLEKMAPTAWRTVRPIGKGTSLFECSWVTPACSAGGVSTILGTVGVVASICEPLGTDGGGDGLLSGVSMTAWKAPLASRASAAICPPLLMA